MPNLNTSSLPLIISPSLLAADFLNLENEIKKLEVFQLQNPQLKLWIHLDIMDGHFVPNLTFGHPIVEKIQAMTKLPLDAHFMVTNPEFYCQTFQKFRIKNFTFHLEVFDGKNERDLVSLLLECKKHYPSVGISLKPNTSIQKILALPKEAFKLIDLILVMSVEPGFGGQKFMPLALEKVKSLRDFFQSQSELQHIQIQIDGGINAENGALAIKAGANNLVSGTAFFKNPVEFLKL